MIRCDSFIRSALAAALAALGWFPWAFAAAPVIGLWHALALYLGAVTVLYVAGVVPRRAGARSAARRLIVGAGAGLLAGVLVVCARSTGELAIGLAALLGVVRSGLLYRTAPLRAVATEVLLLGAGLLFARALAGYSLASIALALWGFLLVQSCFFLIAGTRARTHAASDVDPFDAAHRRATELLGA